MRILVASRIAFEGIKDDHSPYFLIQTIPFIFESLLTERIWRPAIVLEIFLAVTGLLYFTTPAVNNVEIKALESSEGAVRSLNATGEDGHGDVFDRFGIKELYQTKAGGQEWYSSWDNGITRELGYGQRDAYDNIELIGDGSLNILGNEGKAVSSGNAPRIRVVDFDSDNVEITLYGKRISENEEISYQGFVVAARSKHYTDE